MARDNWPTRPIAVASLHLDRKNPRLGRETFPRAPREIIQHLFDNDKALELAESIAARGFFPNEPLLAIREDDRTVVIEGNRRLAALKALREPGLVEGAIGRQVERLARRIADPKSIATVPVTMAPSRRATDRQIVARHIGTPVLAWQAENRASFILEKLEEGYDNVALRDDLGFTLPDIQKARQTRAIADMARSLDLPEELKAKLETPRAKIYTTLGRVFESSVGRDYLMVEPDPDHGLRGNTSTREFLRGFTKLVSDVALGKVSSRTLNTNENIRAYFGSWDRNERPAKKRASFVPSDIITGKSVASPGVKPEKTTGPKPARGITNKVLPRDFKVRFGSDRVVDIRKELGRLDRRHFPNSAAVLLRVFFELAVVDYLHRTGDLPKIVERLGGEARLRYDKPTMKQLVPEVIRIAKARLPRDEANRVEKAIKYDPTAPFTLSDLHAFVHSPSDLPSERDILQFWLRTEPLFRMMLEREIEEAEK